MSLHSFQNFSDFFKKKVQSSIDVGGCELGKDTFDGEAVLRADSTHSASHYGDLICMSNPLTFSPISGTYLIDLIVKLSQIQSK